MPIGSCRVVGGVIIVYLEVNTLLLYYFAQEHTRHGHHIWIIIWEQNFVHVVPFLPLAQGPPVSLTGSELFTLLCVNGFSTN
jgi:hypothetical protein